MLLLGPYREMLGFLTQVGHDLLLPHLFQFTIHSHLSILCCIVYTDEKSSLNRYRIFLFVIAFNPALGPTHFPIQWEPGALSLGLKRSERESNDPPPSSADIKNAWIYISIPPINLHGVILNKARDASSWRGAQLSRGTTLTLPVRNKLRIRSVWQRLTISPAIYTDGIESSSKVVRWSELPVVSHFKMYANSPTHVYRPS